MGSKPQISDQTIEQIKALLAIGRAKNAIAKELGISWATVDKYADINADEIEELREQKKIEFVNEAWGDIKAAMYLGRQKIKLATVAIDEFQGTIDKLIELLEGKEDVKGKDITELIKAISSVTNIPLAQISTYFGTLYDKQALASGEATSRGEITGKNGGPIKQEIDLSKLSKEELELLEKAAKNN